MHPCVDHYDIECRQAGEVEPEDVLLCGIVVVGLKGEVSGEFNPDILLRGKHILKRNRKVIYDVHFHDNASE